MCGTEKCAVHTRASMRDVRTDTQEGPLLIDYTGEYAVMTSTTAPPTMLLALALLGQKMSRFTTCVYRVGDGGALGDIIVGDGWVEGSAVFSQDHDSWENFETAHNLVVDGVRNGTIGGSE